MGYLRGFLRPQFLHSIFVCVAVSFFVSAHTHADDVTPGKIKPSEVVCTNGAEEYGKRSCTSVRAQTIDRLKAGISNWIAWYYDGKVLHPTDSGAGFCVAQPVLKSVCNAASPLDSENSNYRGDSCGSYCVFTKSGLKSTASCQKELAWTRGSRSQIVLNKLDDVISEINGDELKVTSVDQGGVCGNYAKALMKILNGDVTVKQKGLTEVRDQVKQRYEVTKEALKTSELEGCLSNSFTGNETAQDWQSMSLSDSELGKATAEKKHISMGFCNLLFAQKHLEYLFAKLAQCEVLNRAKLEFYSNQYNLDKFMDQMKAKVINPCSNYAEEKITDFVDRMRRCYTGKVTSVSPGAYAFFKQVITPAKQPLSSYDKVKDKSGAEVVYPPCE